MSGETTMNLGPHAAFILAAYAAAIVVIATLIAWIVLDHRAQKRLLGELDQQGVTRRSAAAVKEPA
jgi:heme exporter protein D